MNTFEAARQVSAADVAKRAGIRLERHGGREWACCPFHQEKTPSCMFDPAGRFHCFGCGADGDAIDLHARLYGVDTLTAARELAGDRTIPRTAQTVKPWKPPFLMEPDDQGFTWDTLCAIRHAAQAGINMAKPDSSEFWEMLELRADADNRLENLLAGQ